MGRLSEYELAMNAVIEEAAEVTQVLCKVKRFGLDSKSPSGGTNLDDLNKEIGDLLGAIDFLIEQEPRLDLIKIASIAAAKKPRLLYYNGLDVSPFADQDSLQTA